MAPTDEVEGPLDVAERARLRGGILSLLAGSGKSDAADLTASATLAEAMAWVLEGGRSGSSASAAARRRGSLLPLPPVLCIPVVDVGRRRMLHPAATLRQRPEDAQDEGGVGTTRVATVPHQHSTTTAAYSGEVDETRRSGKMQGDLEVRTRLWDLAGRFDPATATPGGGGTWVPSTPGLGGVEAVSSVSATAGTTGAAGAALTTTSLVRLLGPAVLGGARVHWGDEVLRRVDCHLLMGRAAWRAVLAGSRMPPMQKVERFDATEYARHAAGLAVGQTVAVLTTLPLTLTGGKRGSASAYAPAGARSTTAQVPGVVVARGSPVPSVRLLGGWRVVGTAQAAQGSDVIPADSGSHLAYAVAPTRKGAPVPFVDIESVVVGGFVNPLFNPLYALSSHTGGARKRKRADEGVPKEEPKDGRQSSLWQGAMFSKVRLMRSGKACLFLAAPNAAEGGEEKAWWPRPAEAAAALAEGCTSVRGALRTCGLRHAGTPAELAELCQIVAINVEKAGDGGDSSGSQPAEGMLPEAAEASGGVRPSAVFAEGVRSLREPAPVAEGDGSVSGGSEDGSGGSEYGSGDSSGGSEVGSGDSGVSEDEYRDDSESLSGESLDEVETASGVSRVGSDGGSGDESDASVAPDGSAYGGAVVPIDGEACVLADLLPVLPATALDRVGLREAVGDGGVTVISQGHLRLAEGLLTPTGDYDHLRAILPEDACLSQLGLRMRGGRDLLLAEMEAFGGQQQQQQQQQQQNGSRDGPWLALAVRPSRPVPVYGSTYHTRMLEGDEATDDAVDARAEAEARDLADLDARAGELVLGLNDTPFYHKMPGDARGQRDTTGSATGELEIAQRGAQPSWTTLLSDMERVLQPLPPLSDEERDAAAWALERGDAGDAAAGAAGAASDAPSALLRRRIDLVAQKMRPRLVKMFGRASAAEREAKIVAKLVDEAQPLILAERAGAAAAALVAAVGGKDAFVLRLTDGPRLRTAVVQGCIDSSSSSRRSGSSGTRPLSVDDIVACTVSLVIAGRYPPDLAPNSVEIRAAAVRALGMYPPIGPLQVPPGSKGPGVPPPRSSSASVRWAHFNPQWHEETLLPAARSSRASSSAASRAASGAKLPAPRRLLSALLVHVRSLQPSVRGAAGQRVLRAAACCDYPVDERGVGRWASLAEASEGVARVLAEMRENPQASKKGSEPAAAASPMAGVPDARSIAARGGLAAARQSLAEIDARAAGAVVLPPELPVTPLASRAARASRTGPAHPAHPGSKRGVSDMLKAVSDALPGIVGPLRGTDALGALAEGTASRLEALGTASTASTASDATAASARAVAEIGAFMASRESGGIARAFVRAELVPALRRLASPVVSDALSDDPELSFAVGLLAGSGAEGDRKAIRSAMADLATRLVAALHAAPLGTPLEAPSGATGAPKGADEAIAAFGVWSLSRIAPGGQQGPAAHAAAVMLRRWADRIDFNRGDAGEVEERRVQELKERARARAKRAADSIDESERDVRRELAKIAGPAAARALAARQEGPETGTEAAAAAEAVTADPEGPRDPQGPQGPEVVDASRFF